jgi:hypothetical protein
MNCGPGMFSKKIPGQDFAGQFHEPEGPEKGGPAERFGFAHEEFAEQQAVPVQQYADAIFVAFFPVDQAAFSSRRLQSKPGSGAGQRVTPLAVRGPTSGAALMSSTMADLTGPARP